MTTLFPGFFYANVVITLLKRGRNSERNRSLTLAFCLSWVFWVICWGPYFWGMSTEREETLFMAGPDFDTMYNDLDFSLARWAKIVFGLSKNSIQMIYSHFNALVFLIVLKPFRQWLMKVLKRARVVCCLELRTKPFMRSSGRTVKTMYALILWMTFYLSSLMYLTTVYNQTFSIDNNFMRKRLLLGSFRSKLLEAHLQHEPWFDLSKDPRLKCGRNHASLNLDFKRCYFIENFTENGKNLSEQVDHCSVKDATLFYPRSELELDHVWQLYKQYQRWDRTSNVSIDEDWFLHLGFQSASESESNGSIIFTSVDNLFDLHKFGAMIPYIWDFPGSDWKYAVLSDFPAVCMTSYREGGSLLGCKASDTMKHLVCSIRF